MKMIKNIGLGLLLFTLVARALIGMTLTTLPWWVPLVSVPMFILSILLYVMGAIYIEIRKDKK